MSTTRREAPAPAVREARPREDGGRVAGLDVARALAVVGMLVVNFRLVLVRPDDTGGPAWALTYVDGRAAAVFVVLAGIGASILGRRARMPGADPATRRAARLRLARRGLGLLLLGLPLVVVWDGEILHVYAMFLLVAALLVAAPVRVLAGAAGVALLAHPALNVLVDYRVPTGLETFRPANLTRLVDADAPAAHLFDGHYPLTPWLGFFLVGMLLGRLPLDVVRARVMVLGGLALTAAAEVASAVGSGAASEAVARATNRGPVPPSPVFIVAAVGAALAVVGGCILLTHRVPASRAVAALAATGRCALSLYVAHLVLGLGVAALLGWEGTLGSGEALAYAVVTSALGVAACVLVTRRWSRGPMEVVLRRLAGEGPRRVPAARRALTGRSA